MAKTVASRPCLFRRTLEAIERCSLDRAQQSLTVARRAASERAAMNKHHPRRFDVLPSDLAFDCGMNLALVSVEHSHGDCAGRPGQVGDKFERAHAASRVSAQFPNFAELSRY